MGHDEYWTQQMRNAVTEARDAGIHLGFFSANTLFKRIRLIPDPWTGEPDRVIVSYKTYEGGPVDPSGESTSTWRDPEGMNFPENELVGIQYIGDNDYHYFPLRITAEQAEDKIYRHTPLIHLSPGSYAEIGRRLIGWEWDAVVDNGYTSPKLTILAASPVIGPILDDAGSTYHIGTASAHMIRYISPNGSIVFASGTNQWSWGLAIVEPNRLIQQITYNLFEDMGVFPANPASHLVLGGPYDLVLSTGDEFREFASSTERKNGPKISELQVSVSGNSAQINWITDVPSNGQVWVKIAPGNIDYRQDDTSYWIAPVAASAGHDSFSTTHELTVYLEFNTPYFFQVASTDESRETTVSSDQSLHTNSGSILDQARVMARPLWRSIPCLIRENIFLALYPVALIIVIAPVMIWRMRKVGAPAKETHEVPRDPPEPIL
ncbi:MAG: hypothetical protein MUO58_02455 [Anaerolineales bacterium]|nr:hypothetical protein [Anaerolineales bacterium]